MGGSFTSAGGVSARRIARWNGTSWSAFGPTMFGGAVEALTVFDDGSGPALHAGGGFTSAGGVALNRIARWNGAGWSALGAGTNASVRALAVFDDGSGPALYAGGSFTSAGGVAATRLARWDGASWSALGAGVSGTFEDVEVAALAVLDDGGGPTLLAGGDFSISPARDGFLARWGCGRRVGHAKR